MNIYRWITGKGKKPHELPRTGQSGAALLPEQSLRYLNRLALHTRPVRYGAYLGSRASQERRASSEFLEHRRYTPGDDTRHVDWKASARQEHIFLKQGEQHKGVVVYLLIDSSASMAWGDPPKSIAALRLANALGYLALAHNDRLVVLPVADKANGLRHPMGPLWGKGQTPLLNSYLRAVRFQGQVDLAGTLAGISRRKISRGGLVLVISDLLGVSGLASSLEALPAPIWSVVLCHTLHPQEIDPDLNGYFEMVDIETGLQKRYPVTPRVLDEYRRRLQSWQDEIARTCQEHKATYTNLPTHWSLENEILPRLLRDQVVKRL